MSQLAVPDKLEDSIKIVQMVSKINRSGVQKQQLYINVNDEKMRQYGFDIASMISVLKLQNVTGYTGELSMASNHVIPIPSNSFIKSDNISSDHLLKPINLGTQYFLLSKNVTLSVSKILMVSSSPKGV